MELKGKFKIRNVETGVICDMEVVGDQIKGSWVSREGNHHCHYYSRGIVETHISAGILELVKEEKEMELAKHFTFRFASDAESPLYMALADDEGNYSIIWVRNGSQQKVTYRASSVRDYIAEGKWVVVEVFADNTPTQTEPEYLPPDDIPPYNGVEYDSVWFDELEPVVDYGITLADIRRFTSEVGFVVEVCEDYYVVRQAFDGPRFIANSEEELTAIMQACRTLDGAVDKG